MKGRMSPIIPDACTVYVTAADRDEALRIGRTVVSERLAACANVLTGMTSVYRWRDEIHEDGEAVLLLKTRRALFPDLEARVRALHSYDTPCVVAWPIVTGSEDYLNWIAAETLSPDNVT